MADRHTERVRRPSSARKHGKHRSKSHTHTKSAQENDLALLDARVDSRQKTVPRSQVCTSSLQSRQYVSGPKIYALNATNRTFTTTTSKFRLQRVRSCLISTVISCCVFVFHPPQNPVTSVQRTGHTNTAQIQRRQIYKVKKKTRERANKQENANIMNQLHKLRRRWFRCRRCVVCVLCVYIVHNIMDMHALPINTCTER